MYRLALNSRSRLVLMVAGILLAGSFLAMNLYQSTFAQESGTIEYDENRTDPVATYTAVDPEGTAITSWTVGGTDAGAFTIEGGVLHLQEVSQL